MAKLKAYANMTNSEKLTHEMDNLRGLWPIACKMDGIDPTRTSAVFSSNNEAWAQMKDGMARVITLRPLAIAEQENQEV
jgi:hypothetical protein